MTENMLRTVDLCKNFGGVQATDSVSLQVESGEVHALIGPNGAGKTTLVALLSGLLPADSGDVFLHGENITKLPAHARVHRGLVRSFQITSVFTELSVWDNVALAVQAHAGHSFRFWRNVRLDDSLRRPALEQLEAVKLTHRRDDTVSALSHGERRQLEIAMALATSPSLLLLDEPMAGMGTEESQELLSLLQDLKREKTILLVEHDMETVFTLADRISVLVYGRVIASGSAAEVRASAEVQQAYLGETA